MLWSSIRSKKRAVLSKAAPSFLPRVELLETRLAPASGLAAAPAVFQASGGLGQWSFDPPFNQANQAQSTTIYGLGTDVPVTGDWIGGGTQNIGVFRNGLWVLNTTGTGTYSPSDLSFTFGAPGDLPVVGDWTGNGVTNVGVVRVVNGALEWILDTNGTRQYAPNDATFFFGAAGDVPVTGKWAAPGTAAYGKADVGVFRQGTWILDQHQAFQYQAGVDPVFIYGPANATPISGDWVTPQQSNIGVVYGSGSTEQWVLNTTGSRSYSPADTAFTFGTAGAEPLGRSMRSVGLFQANNTMATALNLGTLSQPLDLNNQALNAASAWFKFTTQGTGADLDQILAQFNPAQTSLAISLFDASGNLVGSTGVHAQDTDRIPLRELPAGTYFLELTGSLGTPYLLHIDAPAPPGPTPPIANNSRATAQNLGTLTGPGTVVGPVSGLLPTGVNAWYQFTLTVNGPASSEALLQQQAVANNYLALELYDAAGNPLQTSSGETNSQGIPLANRSPGTYFLRIFNNGGHAGVNYTLNVELPAPPAPPPPTPLQQVLASLVTPGLAPLIQQDLTNDGQLNRADWIGDAGPNDTLGNEGSIGSSGGIFGFIEQNGAITQGELGDLETILAQENVTLTDPYPNQTAGSGAIPMDNYVYDLASKVVYGDPSNATYQGNALGNLQVGSPVSQLQDLVSKWFLGTDHPDASFYNSVYQDAATNPLFGPNGPSYNDVNQGDVGDCYFMSSLGTIVSRQDPNLFFGSTLPSGLTPLTNQYIGLYQVSQIGSSGPSSNANFYGMFIDNMDGTYSVRFFVQTPSTGLYVPDYVTADRMFPTLTTSKGVVEWDAANAYQKFSDSSIPIWVALAEKAYAQEYASGRLQISNGQPLPKNSYSTIGAGGTSNFPLQEITGQTGYVALSSDKGDSQAPYNNLTFTQIMDAYNSGVGVTFATNGGPKVDSAKDIPLVHGHVYMMIGYDDTGNDATSTITLQNPWGPANQSGTYPSVTDQTVLNVTVPVSFLTTGDNYAAYYGINLS